MKGYAFNGMLLLRSALRALDSDRSAQLYNAVR